MTQPLIAVLDYGIGNLSSAQKALVRSGADARLTRDPGLARDAAGVVLPGVGAFGACMDALRAAQLEDVVYESVASQRPFMGICVGMQMLFTSSVESPGVAGLDVIHGTVELIEGNVRRPQMQWNELHIENEDPLFKALPCTHIPLFPKIRQLLLQRVHTGKTSPQWCVRKMLWQRSSILRNRPKMV
jgi:imidazole glycerol-phosphate synthase subunit HisH